MKRGFRLAALAVCLAGLGCAAAAPVPPRKIDEQKPEDPKVVAAKLAAKEQFELSLAEMARLDGQREGWSPEACERVARGFLSAAAAPGGALGVPATFNAAVAYERCRRDGDAKRLFEQVLARKADYHPAKVHLILMRHRESGGRDIDRAIADMRTAAIVDARYTNVEALVALAMLSLERGSSVADSDGADDRARAVRYLQSALAVDDGYAPAMNGLALHYLGEARGAAGRKAVRSSLSSGLAQGGGSTQAMELAALVCSQAIRKDPNDPVIHNTYGLVQVELGDLGKAAEAFGKARALRPGFFEAEMNFAAVNLQFRGFANAEQAYRAVLKARPDDYDARIGLALALRGQIRDDNADELVEKASAELARAKEIAPERPEAYYNEAILTQEYKARGTGAETKKQLRAARALLEQFMKKAGSRPEYADSVRRAGDRIEEIRTIEGFLEAAPKTEAAPKNGS